MMEIFSDAVKFLADSGVNQWQDGYPNEEIIGLDIQADRSYIMEDDGEIVGTMVLSFEKDPCYADIKGAWLNDEPYTVIHRPAVSAKIRGKGYGKMLFQYAERLTLESGIHNLRADTHRDNKVMNTYLMKYGYVNCGTVLVDSSEGDNLRTAYHKKLN